MKELYSWEDYRCPECGAIKEGVYVCDECREEIIREDKKLLIKLVEKERKSGK